jgi:hypothetical protein
MLDSPIVARHRLRPIKRLPVDLFFDYFAELKKCLGGPRSGTQCLLYYSGIAAIAAMILPAAASRYLLGTFRAGICCASPGIRAYNVPPRRWEIKSASGLVGKISEVCQESAFFAW